MDIVTLKKNAEKILEQAEASGLDEDMTFATTYERYIKQLAILEALGKEIDKIIEDGDLFLNREYIKGQTNTIVHPAIREYNNTAAGANKTLSLLRRIMDSRTEKSKKRDPLLELMAND